MQSGYRNLNLNSKSASDCIHTRTLRHGITLHDLYFPNIIGHVEGQKVNPTALQVDCIIEKINLNERRFLEMRRTMFQLKKRLYNIFKRFMSRIFT